MITEANKAALQKILDSGKKQKCLEFFNGMPEQNRREYFPVVKAFWTKVRKNRFIEDPPGTFSWNPLEGVATTAFFATATGSEILKAKRSGYPDQDEALAIIADRRPDWIQMWVESLLGESSFWLHWRFIRRLIEAGLVKKPDTPRYYLGMISGINSRMTKVDLVEELQRSPDLLKEDIWKLFEYDGDGENSLANTERFEKSWIAALVTLMQQGKLPRAKLMECTVEALERDFNHYRAKWYFEFFDRLEPTDKELKKYAQRLLGLLGASAPNVVTWALGRVTSLAAAGVYDTAVLCHALEPALRAKAKTTSLAALKLLEDQASRSPGDASKLAVTAALALAHEAADVQKAVLKLLDKISSPHHAEVRYQVDLLQPTLAASVRLLAVKWLAAGQPANLPDNAAVASSKASSKSNTKSNNKSNQSQKTRPAALDSQLPKISKQLESLFAIDRLHDSLKSQILSIPAAIFDGTELPRLACAQPIEPIESVEELIDTCARVIEDSAPIDDAERCIDGLARLCASKPKDVDQMTAPLLKRIRKLIPNDHDPFCGLDPANDVMGLFYAFCTGKVIEPFIRNKQLFFEFEGEECTTYIRPGNSVMSFLSARCRTIAGRIAAGDACQQLSAPTHTGGWIDPQALVRRVNAWSGADPDIRDCVLAMLRLAPEKRASALKQLKTNSNEWVQAIAHALGAEKAKVGKTSALWVAAARARAPWQDDPTVDLKHPGLGPDASEVAKVAFQCTERKSGEYTFRDAAFKVEPARPKAVDELLLTVNIYSTQVKYDEAKDGFGASTNGAVRWVATLWPLARESFFVEAVQECFSNLDWWEARWYYRTMLEPLLDSGTPLRHAGLIFLCGMLAAKEPGEAGLASDIAIRAIEDGRLGSDNLGAALSQLLITGLIKPGRWHKTLTDVARASTTHAAVIQVALQCCFVDARQELPKDSAKLLELLYELSLELAVPITNDACRTWLGSGAATGKAVKLAKSLLALDDSSDSKAVISSLLEQAIHQRTRAAAQFTR